MYPENQKVRTPYSHLLIITSANCSAAMRAPCSSMQLASSRARIRKSRAFDQMQLSWRRLPVIASNPEESVYVTSPEDTILAKPEWYRMGGEVSDRQWRDIIGVLKTRAGELDLEYLRKWASELHVSDLLERALKESS